MEISLLLSTDPCVTQLVSLRDTAGRSLLFSSPQPADLFSSPQHKSAYENQTKLAQEKINIVKEYSRYNEEYKAYFVREPMSYDVSNSVEIGSNDIYVDEDENNLRIHMQISRIPTSIIMMQYKLMSLCQMMFPRTCLGKDMAYTMIKAAGAALEPKSEWVQPRVSPYRLATHLTSAFVIYSGILWTALSVVMPEPPSGLLNWVHGATKIRRLALPVSFIVGLTAASGAFVAGNDAGHTYNTFPKMGDVWVPDDIFRKEPLIRNFFENTSLVQLNHRILAMTTLLAVGALWLASKRINLHPAAQSLIGSTLGMATLQVIIFFSN
ncbi:heme A synthase COX15-like [Carex rostrata]